MSEVGEFNRLAGTSPTEVATSAYGYDGLGRLTSLAQAAEATTDYGWTYDARNEVLSFTDSADADESVGSYSYDADGQLTGATPVSGQSDNAANSLVNTYDGNGNAGNINGAGTTTIGAGNTLLFDGTYYDSYDADGNLIQQMNAASTAKTTFIYDNRNRLTSATDSSLEGETWVQTQEVQYTYDMFNNLIGRTVTGGDNAGTQRYVFDGKNMVLAFDGNQNLTDRYLWGPAVDQIRADENFSPSGSNQLPTTGVGTTLWPLADNQNTVRDVVTDSGSVEQHIAYSPFGKQVSALTTTGSTVGKFPIGYTGTYTDPVTGYQLHGVRWYDPASQRWLTRDPSGLGPDSKPYRYCGNGPGNNTDSDGEGGANAQAQVPWAQAWIEVKTGPSYSSALNPFNLFSGPWGQPVTQSFGGIDNLDASTLTPWVRNEEALMGPNVCTGDEAGSMSLFVSAPKGSTWDIEVSVRLLGLIYGQ